MEPERSQSQHVQHGAAWASMRVVKCFILTFVFIPKVHIFFLFLRGHQAGTLERRPPSGRRSAASSLSIRICTNSSGPERAGRLCVTVTANPS